MLASLFIIDLNLLLVLIYDLSEETHRLEDIHSLIRILDPAALHQLNQSSLDKTVIPISIINVCPLSSYYLVLFLKEGSERKH